MSQGLQPPPPEVRFSATGSSAGRILPLVLLLAAGLTGCGAPASDPDNNGSENSAAASQPQLPDQASLELSEFPGYLRQGDHPGDAYQRPELAATRDLDDTAIRALLARLDPLEAEPDDAVEFSLRPASEPPPRAGAVEIGEFPPAEERQPPVVEPVPGPLEIVRFSPDGPVPVAGQVSITFDRPMVAVTAHDDPAQQPPPARLVPEIPGNWRWVGTRTLVFEPEAARLPMATEFSVQVAAGTAAADGSELDEAAGWAFSTPPVSLERVHPAGDSTGLEPLIYAEFDQQVDPEAMLEAMELRAGSESLAVRQAGDDEIDNDTTVARLIDRAEPGRFLVFRATEALPRDTRVEVRVPAGAPSAEGPVATAADQAKGFRTHGPLVVTDQRCSTSRCSPDDHFVLTLSNSLVTDSVDERRIRVEPAIEGMNVAVRDRHITIEGLLEGRTTYTVGLAEGITDEFGQTLEGRPEFSFDVGSRRPRIAMPGGVLVTLDPFHDPAVDVFSSNYRTATIHVHRVEPADWPAYVGLRQQRDFHQAESLPELPGEPVLSEELEIGHEHDTLDHTRLSVGRWLEDEAHGHLLVVLEPGETLGPPPSRHAPGRLASWVQATGIGLDAMADREELLVWATDLRTGEPLADVDVAINGGADGRPTGQDGLARLPLPVASDDRRRSDRIEARHDGQVAILPESVFFHGSGGWRDREQDDSVIWHVFDDRAIYRPGETVHLKGWIRREEHRPDGGLGLVDGAGTIDYRVIDSRGNEIAGGQTRLSRLGGFDLALEIPDTPNLGDARVALTVAGSNGLSGTRHNHSFRIEEFRTPEFEVTTEVTNGPFVGSQAVQASVTAAYYAGGPLPGAEVDWLVSARPGDFRPPNRDEWQFGFQPTWPVPMRGGRMGGLIGDHQGDPAHAGFQGLTDGTGRHDLAIELDMAQRVLPLAINARATVMDVNRQAWSDSSDFLAHPADVYVGMKTDSYFVERGETLRVEFLTVDLDGEIVPDRPVVVEAGRVQWPGRGDEAELADRQSCRVSSDEQGLAHCEFDLGLGGQYQVTAMVTDGHDRTSASRITRWVGGGRLPASAGVEMEEVLLIAEADEYAPGETARVLVQAPFEDAEGLMTLRRHGIAEQHRFRMDGASHTLEIPLREEWMPGIEVHVTLVGQGNRKDARADDLSVDDGSTADPPRPAIATGAETLAITTAERSLQVGLEPAASQLAPGEETRVDLAVHNARGEPVADAEIALVVVDEAILALTGYDWVDPLGVFYRHRPAGVADHHLRPTIALAVPEEALEKLDARAAMALEESMDRVTVTGSRLGGVPDGDPAIDVREDFNPLAAFVPGLVSDEQGRVSTSFRLPDNLTRYRVMAVAVAGTSEFGTAESAITARLPLMVRPGPPRFLNFGDTLEFPVVLQNQTDRAMDVAVALEAHNLELTGARGFGLEVPANDRVEVRFPAAARKAGTARFQLAAVAGGDDDDGAGPADAARGELPVWTPATTEAFATYGVIDEGAIVQPVIAPTDVWPQFGQLEITTTSTALQSLTDAFIYLHDYPFRGTAQTASRMLAIAALADVLGEFGVEDLPGPDEIEVSMERDLELLAGRQNADGGFGLWRRGQDSWPYVTLHVAHALIRARDKGYRVDDELYDSTLAHVVDIEEHIPGHYGDRARRHVVAYSLYLRGLTDDFDRARARALIDAVDDLAELSFESTGWLLGVLSGDPDSAGEIDRLRRFLANRVTETAAAAHFVSDWRDDAHLILQSDRCADAIILEALMDDDPDSDLIPKIVHGLQAHRTRGRWGNTQENAFVLLALDKYFRRFEAETPDFVARTWLGGDFAGEHHFSGRTTESHRIDVPMAWLAERDGPRDLVLDKDGDGRLYYRAGLAYAPRELDLAAASHGFEVERSYRGADDAADVKKRDDGTWEIRAGSRVEVELTLVAPTRRYHVALVDPLPAGLETLNPALAVTAVNDGHPPRSRPHHGWWGPWYEHQNLRDERTEAFASILGGGVYTYTYYARATTPGEFVVPPARAEEMYHPETFGRSASARVIVTDPSR